MERKLTREKIKALSQYKRLEKEFGESIAENLTKEMLREWERFKEHGNYYANMNAYTKNYELDFAHRAFSEIQYKKLFNLERQWRAGKVQLDIDCSYIFGYYYTLIHECPFIEPVTPAEVAAYKEYLFELDDFPERIIPGMDHARIVTAAFQKTSDYPKWYTFFDKKFNTGDLLYLTDLVYEYEIRCVRKHFEKKRSASPENFAKAADEFHALMEAFETGDYSNIAMMNNQNFLELAHVLNDKKYALKLQNEIERENTTPDLYLELAYNYLDSILFETPPIKHDYDNWQDGIYETAAEYLKIQIIKQLDGVYEDYKNSKLNRYEEKERKKAKDELKFWQDAYFDGKKKLEK